MDYSIVTETPEIKITKEALSMLYTRYGFSRSFCRDKEVLEVHLRPRTMEHIVYLERLQYQALFQ